jgi:hypothetical protein
MSILTILVFAAILGCIPGAIAQSKGHSFVAWWIFGALLFVVALPCALFIEREGRKCPYCAETVRTDAVVCRFCSRDLPPRPPQWDPVA